MTVLGDQLGSKQEKSDHRKVPSLCVHMIRTVVMTRNTRGNIGSS